ncbi:hypothetical protein D1816_02695 [Aquimarina sp. AD10]|uniref:hypothetical protein n=1 Tax=Aquimarina sp. AD10 TaxID=1714849 RepID=UPI000E548032|nr:hypothetical protein [Aquimarina sp. AD10]AXT59297.1 hypothetical protein D1816_02695 [Aquimarina sp. AD10]RKM95196.1 hypothetical protein D7033_17295 [Aquimarina sp. AD10]
MENTISNGKIENLELEGFPPQQLMTYQSIQLTKICCSEEISFNNISSNEIIPPVVKAYFSEKKDQIIVEAKLFIISSFIPSEITMTYQYTTCTTGVPQITIYFIYNTGVVTESLALNGPNGKSSTSIYNLYSCKPFTLKAQNPITGPIINIQSFLRDIDPVTSRGTVTTVQPS